ncbi:MAG: CHC2 zinc finger domain-containing protein [Actinobacteria bacterium]|nr:CHC2 zinc finger domain-containing protein [Actinomycetota bacterium]
MAKSLKDGEVNELKLNADIYNVISSYVSLKKSGKNFTGLCPFHKEKTPSFIVDTKTQLYHCFGCGAGGDVISFIMKAENLSFMEAVELLAKKTGYDLKYSESEYSAEPDAKSKLFELNELAKKYFNYILFKSKNGIKALNYLKSRKISPETLQLFEVGYSPDNWDNFTNFAKSRKFTETEIVQSGLGIESMKENRKSRVYDRFRGRIMFPIKDLLGRTIGFGGRILPEQSDIRTNIKTINPAKNINTIKTSEIFQRKEGTAAGINIAKYINTPETKLYSKSKNIFGIFEAKSHIVGKDFALIVEGYMDMLALYDNGIKNTVASLGTALTGDQIKLLSRFTKNIILVFDADEAGRNASIKGIDRLREYNDRLDLFNENNINMKVCILEKDFDPADFIINKGADAFLKKVEDAIDIIDFTLDMIISKHNLDELTGKLRASDELLKFISSLSSSIIQEGCIKKIALKLKLKESMLIEEMLKKKITPGRSSGLEDENEDENSYVEFLHKNLNPQKKLEIEALNLIINGFDYPEMQILNLPSEYFRFEDTKKLVLLIKEFVTEQNNLKNNINFPMIISSDKFTSENIRKLYNYIYFSSRSYTDKKESCDEVVLNLKRQFLSEKIEKLRIKVSEIEQKIKNDKNNGNEDSLKSQESEYDLYYKELIKLENEKLILGETGSK